MALWSPAGHQATDVLGRELQGQAQARCHPKGGQRACWSGYWTGKQGSWGLCVTLRSLPLPGSFSPALSSGGTKHFKEFILVVCVCVMSVCGYVKVYVGAHGGQRKAWRPPGTAVRGDCGSSDTSWEQNSDSLQEQKVLLRHLTSPKGEAILNLKALHTAAQGV